MSSSAMCLGNDSPPDCDRALKWRLAVERAELRGVDRQGTSYWDRLAAAYDYYTSQVTSHPFLEVLEPFLSPEKTLIDIGCGPGTHLVTLAARLAAVVGVEPSSEMRRRIPPIANAIVIAARWEDALVEPADLVISSLVLNFVVEPVAFIAKMEAYARERCFLHLLDDSGARPLDELYTVLSGLTRPRSPRFADAYNLLRWMGIRPHVVPLQPANPPHWESFEAAVADCRARLVPVWQEAVGRSWLADHLRPVPGGGLCLGEGRPTAVAHWRPRRVTETW